MISVALGKMSDLLDRAHDQERLVTVWWRDDDAVADTPALSRLLSIATDAGAPVSVATVPTAIEPSLTQRLSDETTVDVLVHGYAHRNHARPPAKSAEFSLDRPLSVMLDEASRALALTRAAFGRQCLPVFVPPWNRIAPAVAGELGRLGYAAVSTFGAGRAGPLPGYNTHLDPVDWRGHRGLAGDDALAAAFKEALAIDGPIGLLTHHLVFDERLWRFTTGLVTLLAGHPAVRLARLRDICRPGSPKPIAALPRSAPIPSGCSPP